MRSFSLLSAKYTNLPASKVSGVYLLLARTCKQRNIQNNNNKQTSCSLVRAKVRGICRGRRRARRPSILYYIIFYYNVVYIYTYNIYIYIYICAYIYIYIQSIHIILYYIILYYIIVLLYYVILYCIML